MTKIYYLYNNFVFLWARNYVPLCLTYNYS